MVKVESKKSLWSLVTVGCQALEQWISLHVLTPQLLKVLGQYPGFGKFLLLKWSWRHVFSMYVHLGQISKVQIFYQSTFVHGLYIIYLKNGDCFTGCCIFGGMNEFCTSRSRSGFCRTIYSR